MKVKIIGGHGGVSPGHRATSYLIDDRLLIDAGSVASGIPISEQKEIDHILISHAHLDHINELAYLCDNCFGLRTQPFEVYANAPVKQAIMTHLFNDIIWPDFSKLPSKERPTIRINDLAVENEITLGEYTVKAIEVNHQGGACGFIITNKQKRCTLLFTQDTGPTDLIWQYAHREPYLKAIFSEISFPNALEKVAVDSCHHTPQSFLKEIDKMPIGFPLYVGHLKPNFKEQLFSEIKNYPKHIKMIMLDSIGEVYHF